jgi:hypothetical protein
LGSDPRAITLKNANMTDDERYNSLCSYYKIKFNLNQEIQTRCTLKTEIIGHGQKWSDLDRKFIWGLME